MMPKALFFNVPAHGHINPSLPLVAELVRRGHEITYYATESYRLRIEATGTSLKMYAAVADDYFDSRRLNGSEPQKAAHALLTMTKAILPELVEATSQAQPDYILYDCMCPWGYYLAQITKLPSVSSFALMPLSMRIMRDWRALRLFMPSLIRDFAQGVRVNRLSHELGKQYSVKPLGATEALNARGDLSISYSSSYYVPYADSLPGSFRFVGWTMQESALDEPFTHDSNRPLIYASLGTVINENAGFYELCIKAFADTAYDVLISTGGRFSPEQFGTLPENITIRSWVPQSQVIQQAALFVTHGGLNSLHDGLYCGLPLLVVPQQTEQTFNAMRVVDLGAGLMLKTSQLSASALLTSVTKLLSDGSYRVEAKRIGDTFRAAGGVARAADEIEVLLRKHTGSQAQ